MTKLSQLNTLMTGQDVYDLKKECEEKDATIKELSAYLHSSEAAGSKVHTPVILCAFLLPKVYCLLS